MFAQYLPIMIIMIIAFGFAVVVIAASNLLGQRVSTPVKLSPYECGVTTIGPTHRRISIKFYVIALLFLLFDIEVVFMYPWAVLYKRLGDSGSSR